MPISTVSTRGQLVIPKKIREKYNIDPQSSVRWIDTGEFLILIPMTNDSIASSRGILKGAKVSTHSYLGEKKEEKSLEERKLKRGEKNA
jgi:AbrB family looped-hinge helix DNA binding protein